MYVAKPRYPGRIKYLNDAGFSYFNTCSIIQHNLKFQILFVCYLAHAENIFAIFCLAKIKSNNIRHIYVRIYWVSQDSIKTI